MSELIDKQSVLNVLEEIRTLTVNGVEKRSAVYGLIDGYTGMIRCKVNQLPVTQPKRGKWICTGIMEEAYAMEYRCSVCGSTDFGGDYCSNCGAKMENDEDETD